MPISMVFFGSELSCCIFKLKFFNRVLYLLINSTWPYSGWGDRGKKATTTSFSLVKSTNVGISLQNILTFDFNPFAILLSNFKSIPSTSPKLLNLNQDHRSKYVVFLFKFLSNGGYDNFSHRNSRVTKLWSHDNIYNIIWLT